MFFYQSPVGILELRSNGTALTHLLFVNSWKGTALDEDSIQFTAPADAVLQQCTNELNEYFAGTRKVFTVPVNQDGTSFQLTVWDALCGIPYGHTISYMELSKRIGNVKAIRAVGTANGSNHVSIIVPCHRVIGSNGSLVGYGGDLWRKRWLLDHENRFGNGVQELF
ncbi:MAG: methylated-DNA--[protein]-cysteine S-methyltransferase [Bacteroidetes bacterium]|nr:methylated-DNA--[protein]-cysteine S-methyltransferase [Bacteroidota bacterium]